MDSMEIEMIMESAIIEGYNREFYKMLKDYVKGCYQIYYENETVESCIEYNEAIEFLKEYCNICDIEYSEYGFSETDKLEIEIDSNNPLDFSDIIEEDWY